MTSRVKRQLVVCVGIMLVQAAIASGAVPSEGNPLVPKYPFSSVRITYKKTADFEAVAHVSGVRSHFRTVWRKDGKETRTETTFTDGKYLCETETGDGGKKATVQLHVGAFLAADYSGLDDQARRKFDAGLESFLNRYSPVFMVDWVGAQGVEIKVQGAEKVLGRECEVFTVRAKGEGPRLDYRCWRWKGTDIILRMEAQGMKLEAEKIEEGVAVPDSLFKLPVASGADDAANRELAKRIFKELSGKDALADQGAAVLARSTMTIDGHAVKLDKPTYNFMGRADLGTETGMLEINSPSEAQWQFHLVVPVAANTLGEIRGKPFRLKGEEEVASLYKGDLSFVTREAEVKIVEAGERAVVLELTGKWLRVDTPEDGDQREIEIKADKLTVSAGPP